MWLKEELYLNEPVIFEHDWKTFCVTMAKQYESENTDKVLKQFKLTFADSWKRRQINQLVNKLTLQFALELN